MENRHSGHGVNEMSKTKNKKSVRSLKLRATINNVIRSIESVMTNTNIVMGEVENLVKDIDKISARLEARFGQGALNESDVRYDSNRNVCEPAGPSGWPGWPEAASNSVLPSPNMDYTFLDLSQECTDCGMDNIRNISYTAKYPLWIQCDSWRAPTSVSELSEVSEVSTCFSSCSDRASQHSLNNLNNAQSVYQQHQEKRQTNENMQKIRQCCVVTCINPELTTGGNYCGLYEDIMEAKLEDLVWTDLECDESLSDSDHLSDGY
ncbi:hypothetical protein MAR_000755 [Mya arenaria]|uniref:Uncharacterized protein n=1 Tax=Mya arenaria TaxID=6604 RepID=A0ABY7FBD1_MYAAR|nr:hypothetical protein MAR_000755 [Mya arenaria]